MDLWSDGETPALSITLSLIPDRQMYCPTSKCTSFTSSRGRHALLYSRLGVSGGDGPALFPPLRSLYVTVGSAESALCTYRLRSGLLKVSRAFVAKVNTEGISFPTSCFIVGHDETSRGVGTNRPFAIHNRAGLLGYIPAT